jgi:hypothetical protein
LTNSSRCSEPDLLLAFDQILDVQRIRPAQRFHRLDLRENLPLHVRSAPRIDVIPADRRLERTRLPLVQRIHRLHVVVTVHQHGGFVRRAPPFGVHHRMHLRGDNLGRGYTQPFEAFREPLRGAGHVVFVFGKGRDARHAQEFLEFLEVGLAMRPGILDGGVHSGHALFLSCLIAGWPGRELRLLPG